MLLRFSLILCFLSFLFFSCQNKSASKEINSKHLYDKECSICHGTEGIPSIKNAKNLQKSTITESEIKQIILKGSLQMGMPSFENRLKISEVDSLVAYVKSLRK